MTCVKIMIFVRDHVKAKIGTLSPARILSEITLPLKLRKSTYIFIYQSLLFRENEVVISYSRPCEGPDR